MLMAALVRRASSSHTLIAYQRRVEYTPVLQAMHTSDDLKHPQPGMSNRNVVSAIEYAALQVSLSNQLVMQSSVSSANRAAYNEPCSAFSSDSSSTSDREPNAKHKRSKTTRTKANKSEVVQVMITSDSCPRDTKRVLQDDVCQKHSAESTSHTIINTHPDCS